MKQWNLAPASSTLLIAILLVIGMIQILPQVDLPDTAFQEDTAPMVIKSRGIAAPVMVHAPAPSKLISHDKAFPELAESRAQIFIAPVASAPVLNCSLRC